jgi:hypothetical protein
MSSLYRLILGWLQRMCVHPPESVVADIHEGDGDIDTKWCRVCGSYKFGEGTWREMRPEWED